MLQQEVYEYLENISDLRTLILRRQTKRGLIDPGGHRLTFLFRTLVENDLALIDNKMNNLYAGYCS